MTKSKKLVCIWATASIIAALVIHGLFHLNAPNEWFIAAWSAGDILTYFSTVTLGLLAVWQNGKIQKSNEESQARLEKISQEANKLNIVGKIIEHETARISKLESLFDEFEICCDPKNIEEISKKQEELNQNQKEYDLLSKKQAQYQYLLNKIKIGFQNLNLEFTGNIDLDKNTLQAYKNDFNRNSYGGMAPPNKPHYYDITVYALDCFLDINEGFSYQELKDKIKNHIIDEANIKGLYEN